MAIFYNGQEIKTLKYDDQDIQTVNYNGQDFSMRVFQNKWSGGIQGLPLIYDSPNGPYVNYIDILPGNNGDSLIFVPDPNDYPCFLGGGLSYNTATERFEAEELVSTNDDTIKLSGGAYQKYDNNLVLFSPTVGTPYLKFRLFYNTLPSQNCVWWPAAQQWASDYTDEYLDFDPVTHRFSGQTRSHTWGSLDYIWTATTKGDGFSLTLDGVNYGTIYLT